MYVSYLKRPAILKFLWGVMKQSTQKFRVRTNGSEKWFSLMSQSSLKTCMSNLTKILRVNEKTKPQNCTLFTIYAHKSESSFPGSSGRIKSVPQIRLFRTYWILFVGFLSALASFHPEKLFAHFAPLPEPNNGKTMHFIFCQKLTPNTAMKQLSKQKAEQPCRYVELYKNVWKLCIIMR